MDISKLQEAITELEQEAARCLRVAGELKDVMKRSGNGVGHTAPQQLIKPRPQVQTGNQDPTTTSQLAIAVDVLRSLKKPTHITELVPLIAERRKGAVTTRATVESSLVRGMKGGKWKNTIRRTGPGTFEATH